jgi:pimeloyl-ACP methyl ester carboxylesterase
MHETPRITVRDTPVDLLRAGAGPPLLYLHGGGAGGRWLAFQARLAGIVCSGVNGGCHEATLEMMQMFAAAVMPHFREDAHVDETAGVGR